MVEERLLFVRNSFIRLSQPLYSDTMVPLYRKLKGLLPIFPLGRMAPSRAREKERERKRLDPPFLRRQSLSLKPWKQQRRRRRERAEGAKKTFGSLLQTQGPPSALDTSPAGRESEKEVGREEEGGALRHDYLSEPLPRFPEVRKRESNRLLLLFLCFPFGDTLAMAVLIFLSHYP